MIPWEETDNPFRLVAARLGNVSAVGLSDRMLALSGGELPRCAARRAPGAGRRRAAGAADQEDLGRGGGPPGRPCAAIDRVHARVPGWLRPGLTERAVGAVITEAILAEDTPRWTS